MYAIDNGNRRAGAVCSRLLHIALTVLCLVVLAVIVRPLLRGLAVVAADVVLAVALALTTYLALRRTKRKSSAPAEPAPELEDSTRPEPLIPPTPSRETALQIESELRAIKKGLGKG